MSKRITQTNYIQSGDDSGVEVSGAEKIRYSEPFEADDFEDDDLINRRAVVTLIDANIPETTANVGIFTINDTGPTEILIPHGLDLAPSSWNVNPKNSNAKNLGISDENADNVNIKITLIFSNADSLPLEYLWQAWQ